MTAVLPSPRSIFSSPRSLYESPRSLPSCSPRPVANDNSSRASPFAPAAMDPSASEHLFQKGLVHLYGWHDFVENVQKAKMFMHRAAKLGHLCARAECAYKGWGEPRDVQMALEIYKKLAENGHAHAMHRLGCYWDFDAEKIDPSEAVRWYRKAAIRGHISASYNLSVAYNFGLGVASDAKRAFKWCTLSAKAGHRSAQHNLACAYEQGRGIANRMPEKAVKWYRKAAQQGHPKSAYNLGICYQDGTGVKQSIKMSLHWLKKAADSGHPPAHFQIGQYYLNAKQTKEAIRWFWWAADKGCKEAASKLRTLPRKEVDQFFNDTQKSVENALERDFRKVFMLFPSVLDSFRNRHMCQRDVEKN